MAKGKNTGVRYVTPKFRASWCYVIRPRPEKTAQGKDQYSITMLFEKGQDLTELKKAILQAGVNEWGEDRSKWPKLKSTPLKDQGDALRKREDGTEFLPDGYTPGALYMEAKTYQKPGLVDQKLTEIIDETQFYSGCWARAEVMFKTYDFKGQGITCYLQHVQKVADGDPLGGRTRPEDAFSAIEDAGGESFQSAEGTDPVDALMGS